MTPSKIFGPAVVLVALSLAPLPADAGQRRGGGGGGARSGSPRSSGGSRSFSSPRSSGSFSGSRTFSSPRSFSGGRTSSFSSRSYGPSRGYVGSRGYIGSRGYVGSRYYGGYGYRTFARPYYSFRSRFSLGFGLFVGYPVAYPYYYDYGYPYSYYPSYSYSYGYPGPYYAPYPYSYSSGPAYDTPVYPDPGYRSSAPYPNDPPQAAPQGSGSVEANPGAGTQDFGGVSFNISPSDAQVYADGQYMGTVGNFSPSSQPLTLSPGRHHIEIRANGYKTMSFDSDIVRGQVIPYQGTMQR